MPLSLAGTSALVGRYRGVELGLHRRLGALSGTCEHAGVAVELAAAASAHGWRAELWAPLLPVSVGLPPASELVKLPAEVDSVLDTAIGAALPAVAVLDGLVEVLYPAMLDEYETRARAGPGASGRPLATAARRAADDLRSTLVSIEKMLARLLEEGEAEGLSVGETTLGLQQVLAAAGGPFGDLAFLG